MFETCDLCGRTYTDAEEYDAHLCVTFTGHIDTCFEEVSRRKHAEPCGRVAVAHRIGADGRSYPVCRTHVRAPMVPLAAFVRYAQRGWQ